MNRNKIQAKTDAVAFTDFNDHNDPDSIGTSEMAAIEFEVAFIGKLIKAPKKCSLAQRQLVDLSGLEPPATDYFDKSNFNS